MKGRKENMKTIKLSASEAFSLMFRKFKEVVDVENKNIEIWKEIKTAITIVGISLFLLTMAIAILIIKGN